jgi:hypothetical protein
MSTKKKAQKPTITLNVERGGLTAPKVKREYYSDPEELANKRFVQRVSKWQALENFHELRATDLDWALLQYWLYFTEDLISIFDFGSSDARVELAHQVEDALIEALYVAGRNYKTSNRTFMYMTQEERDLVRDALLICDELFDLVTEFYNPAQSNQIYTRIDKHVCAVLSVPEGK